jgi:NAD(P)-dependent dehydrogenase (short-subunit alcohol dehydrogenase family)
MVAETSSRVCVVTGAGAGLGAASARRFAAGGDCSIVVDRDAERAESVARSIVDGGGAAVSRHVDVANEESVIELADWLRKEHGAVDVLVNCAGLALREGSVVDMTRKAWDLTIAVNLTGTFLMCRHLVPLMAPGSVVVNVSTSGVLRTVSGTDAYIAAKGGVLALTKAMAVSLADRGVRVNVVCPGVFGTEEVEHRLDDPRVKTMLARTAPVGRGYGEPGEFAATVEFLCSPAASFINAAEITVDGGGSA